jgi:hypothetical protein
MARRARAERPEKAEERKFCSKVRLLGAEVLKQGGQGPYGMGGFNDRLALCPKGTALFLEFKRIINGKIEEPTKRQQSRHRLLKNLGFQTHVVGTAARAFKLCRAAMKERGVAVSIRKRWRL